MKPWILIWIPGAKEMEGGKNLIKKQKSEFIWLWWAKKGLKSHVPYLKQIGVWLFKRIATRRQKYHKGTGKVWIKYGKSRIYQGAWIYSGLCIFPLIPAFPRLSPDNPGLSSNTLVHMPPIPAFDYWSWGLTYRIYFKIGLWNYWWTMPKSALLQHHHIPAGNAQNHFFLHGSNHSAIESFWRQRGLDDMGKYPAGFF